MRHTANIKTATVNKVAGLSKQAERDALARDFGLESFTPQPGMIYTRVRAISARVNRNFDGFESSELKRAYTTFEGRPVFVNHENHDPTRTRGIVVASAYREDGDDRYIELLIEVDAQAFPKLAQEIADGNIDSVSMGCEVESTICSYCGNEADDLGDFCEHVLHHKGQTLQRAAANGEIEDVLVYEICRGVNFFEISFVFDPADETALAQTVLDARTARLKRAYATFEKRAYDDRVAPQQVDTLTNSDPCPACGAEDFNGTQCRWCDYVTPPKELQDPDTSKAKEYDLRNEPEDDHGDAPDTDQEDHTMPRNPRDRQAAIRRLAEVNRVIAARRKTSGLDWGLSGTDPYAETASGDTFTVAWADGDQYYWALNDEPMDIFDTVEEAKAAADQYALEQGLITARRRPTARRNTINREVNMNRRKQATRRRPTARRKQASSLSWKVDNGLLVADVPGGGFYQIDEGYRGDYYLSYHSFLGDTGDEIGDAFSSEEQAKAAAEAHASGKSARRKRASMDWSILSDGQFSTEIPGGGIYVYETDEDGWAYSVRSGGEFSNDPDVDYADGFDTSDAAISAAEREWANEGITARRKRATRGKQASFNWETEKWPSTSEVYYFSTGTSGKEFQIIQDGSRRYTLYVDGEDTGPYFHDFSQAEWLAGQIDTGSMTLDNSWDAPGARMSRRKRASLAWDQVASDVASAYDGKGHYIEVWYHQDEGWDYAIYTDTDGGREMTVPRGSSPMFDTLEEAKSAAESAVQGLTTARRKRATRRKQASELEPDEIPADFPVRPLATQAEIDAAGDPVQDGECGLWWDDSISTSITPAPGGRCPFEEFHDYDDDGYYARRKRADADTDAAQPDERADLDETGDPVNSNADEEAAKPDEQVDVTTPDETQPADATDSQYDPNEYENQGGAPVKASAMQALALIEAYEEHGIITNDERLAKFAELEKTSATIVQDRLDLLAQVKAAGAKAPTRTAKRSTVPRSATPQRPTPSMGRAASTGDTQLPDYLITL